MYRYACVCIYIYILVRSECHCHFGPVFLTRAQYELQVRGGSGKKQRAVTSLRPGQNDCLTASSC